MHMWIVIAAFALAAVTPFMSAPRANDETQLSEMTDEPEDLSEDKDGSADA